MTLSDLSKMFNDIKHLFLPRLISEIWDSKN